MPTKADSRFVLTKQFGDSTILASPKSFESKVEAAEEALAIVGHGDIEITEKEIVVRPYLKEEVVFRLSPVSNFL